MTHPDNPTGSNQRSSELAALIERLADKSLAQRELAASEIFRIGRERAIRCLRGWFSDPAVLSLFVLDKGDFPRTTVGVAVEPQNFERIRTANGLPRLADVPADLNAREFEIDVMPDVRLDILTTRDARADGAIARFLRKLGEGIQQVELEVRSVDRASAMLRDRFRIALIYSDARSGADRTRVNFFLLPDGNEKLLIELVESPGAPH